MSLRKTMIGTLIISAVVFTLLGCESAVASSDRKETQFMDLDYDTVEKRVNHLYEKFKEQEDTNAPIEEQQKTLLEINMYLGLANTWD